MSAPVKWPFAGGGVADVQYLDRRTPGWFLLNIFRVEVRRWDWVALMVDVHPDELKHCRCDFPALFFVHPDEYKPGERVAQQRWLRIPGKYRSKDAAWDAFRRIEVRS